MQCDVCISIKAEVYSTTLLISSSCGMIKELRDLKREVVMKVVAFSEPLSELSEFLAPYAHHFARSETRENHPLA